MLFRENEVLKLVYFHAEYKLRGHIKLYIYGTLSLRSYDYNEWPREISILD